MDKTSHRFEINRARDGLDPELVLRQLEKIVGSSAFQGSPRRRDLLSWLVRLTLDNRGAEITERAIAAAIFGKTEDFEPTEDAIVRVEFSRLRAGLDTYYSREGRNDLVQISIPKRTYIPEFLVRVEDVAVVSAPVEAPETTLETPPAGPRGLSRLTKRSWLAFVSAALLVLISGVTLKLASGEWHAPWGRPGTPEFQQVTLLPGRQVHPSLSPDHSLVAFSWDAENDGNFQLFIKPVERMGVTRLTAGPGASRSPAWSPDGNSVAFLRRLPNLGQEVRLIPSKGGEERVLTTIRTIVQGIAWTPDSRYLIVPDGVPGKLLALFLVSVATGERHRLTEYDSFFEPDLSPDGRTLAFETDTEPGRQSAICLMPLGPDFLPAGPVTVLHQTTGEVLFWPTWSPSGDSVLYAKQFNSIWSLFRLTVAGGQVQPIPAAGRGVTYGREFSPGRLLLVRQRERDFLATIPHGSRVGDTTPLAKPVPLFQSVEQDFAAGLSADGKKVAFISHRGGQRGLWIANTDGAHAIRVAVPGGLVSKRPVWSPDGQYVYFWATPEGSADRKSKILRARVQPASMQAELVQLDGADNMNPGLSRDGRWLYFTSNRAGTFEVWRTPIAGGQAEAMSPPIAGGLPPLGEESFDGKYLFYSSPEGIWRLSLKDRKRDLYLPVGPGGIRVGENGIYYDSVVATPDGLVNFHPFAPGSSELQFSLGLHHGWFPMSGDQGLLASLVRLESNLELFTAR